MPNNLWRKPICNQCKNKKGFKNFNDGDWLFFATFGMFASSLMMGLSIGNFDFANEIIIYLVPMALMSYGYSLLLNSKNKKARRVKDK